MDRDEIVKIAFKGKATPWLGMISPGALDTENVNAMCPYDPNKAKAILAEAGYVPEHPLTCEILAGTEKSVFNVIATVIKAQMMHLGVTANIKLVDKVTWGNTVLQDAPWDIAIEDLLSQLTPDSNAYLSTTGSTCCWSFPLPSRASCPVRAGCICLGLVPPSSVSRVSGVISST
jgi:ABC-type transport system substrate-binding protein